MFIQHIMINQYGIALATSYHLITASHEFRMRGRIKIHKLQRIQNMAARLVHKLPKFSHVTPLLMDLHWLPVEYCIKYKLLLFTYKGIHQMAPQYINEMFTRKSTRYRSQLSSVARGIVFVNGNVSGDIVLMILFTYQCPGQECYI